MRSARFETGALLPITIWAAFCAGVIAASLVFARSMQVWLGQVTVGTS